MWKRNQSWVTKQLKRKQAAAGGCALCHGCSRPWGGWQAVRHTSSCRPCSFLTNSSYMLAMFFKYGPPHHILPLSEREGLYNALLESVLAASFRFMQVSVERAWPRKCSSHVLYVALSAIELFCLKDHSQASPFRCSGRITLTSLRLSLLLCTLFSLDLCHILYWRSLQQFYIITYVFLKHHAMLQPLCCLHFRYPPAPGCPVKQTRPPTTSTTEFNG